MFIGFKKNIYYYYFYFLHTLVFVVLLFHLVIAVANPLIGMVFLKFDNKTFFVGYTFIGANEMLNVYYMVKFYLSYFAVMLMFDIFFGVFLSKCQENIQC